MKNIFSISILIMLVSFLNGCSVMRSVGGALTDYGEKTDGVVGDIAGAVGTVYETVGCEGVAKNDVDCNNTSTRKSNSQVTLVKEAQKRLNEFGYSAGPIDGIMGAGTAKSIQEFQRDKGLVVSGKLNSVTIKALGL